MRRLYAFAFVAALAIAPAPAQADTELAAAVAAGGRLVAAEELKRLYFDNVVVGVTPSGYEFRTEVRPDGTLPATERRGPGTFDAPENGMTCLHFPDLWEGKPRCWWHVRVDGAHRMYLLDGSLAAELSFEPK